MPEVRWLNFHLAFPYVWRRFLRSECRARQWILHRGGVLYCTSWGKFWLSVLGVYEWEGVNPMPPEMWLLPYALPIHPGRMWCHCRMVYLPMSYVYGAKGRGELLSPFVRRACPLPWV